MTFPVWIPLGPIRLHPHAVFEALAYFIGFRLYLALRRRRGDTVEVTNRWWAITGAAAGGALGAKLLFLLEDPWTTAASLTDVSYLMSGKTVVGGLIGGLIGVEWTKWMIGERRSTGDLFALPLAVGIAIGRVGCFLTGLSDQTFGTPTSMPWGVDFGDGIARHPTQLYEVAALLAIARIITRQSRRPHASGDLFKLFMVSYLGFRLMVDALKPGVSIAFGLTAIQWACVGALAYYARLLQASGAGIPRPDILKPEA